MLQGPFFVPDSLFIAPGRPLPTTLTAKLVGKPGLALCFKEERPRILARQSRYLLTTILLSVNCWALADLQGEPVHKMYTCWG